jgi:Ca2+-binding EF-hand superfamily protein
MLDSRSVRTDLLLNRALLLLAVVATSGGCGASNGRAMDPSLLALDTDKDGTISLVEAKAGASAKFDTIDANHDGTLDVKDLAAANVDKAEIERADHDHNGTLTKDEYLALVEDAFKAADRTGDGKLSSGELQTGAGQKLRSLMQ